MKPLCLLQNTPEWREFRKTKVGASDIAVLMIGTEWEIYNLYLEKKFGKEKYETSAMRRGIEMEEEARGWFSSRLDISFQPEVCISDENPWLMASFDGMNEKYNIAVEIKCPLEIPDQVTNSPRWETYYWQVQAQLLVSGHDSQWLLLYSPREQRQVEVYPDPSAQEKIVAKGKWFYEFLVTDKEFPTPFVERNDEEWGEAATAWKSAKEILDNAKEQEAICREAMIYLAQDKSTIGSGLKVTKVPRAGGIDYTKVPELKNIDLRIYQKPGIITWRLTSQG